MNNINQNPNINILELFCGNGNHTVAIAIYAKTVVSVEINKSLCQAAETNLKLNNIHNVHIIPCDSQKFAYQIMKNKCIYVLPHKTNSNSNSKRDHIPLHDTTNIDSCSVHVLLAQSPTNIQNESISNTIPPPSSSSSSTSSSNSFNRKNQNHTNKSSHKKYIDNNSNTNTNTSDNNTDSTSTNISEKIEAIKEKEKVAFDMILVDPPRCGLDENTRKLIGHYDYILYISCNPQALKRDIEHVSSIDLFFISLLIIYVVVTSFFKQFFIVERITCYCAFWII